MQRSATAFATSTGSNRKASAGVEFGAAVLGIFIDALTEGASMIKLEGTVDPVTMLATTAKVAEFVKTNTDKPDTVRVETSMSGEIRVYVKNKRVFEAKKDFMNDQLWSIEVDRRVHEALTKPNLF